MTEMLRNYKYKHTNLSMLEKLHTKLYLFLDHYAIIPQEPDTVNLGSGLFFLPAIWEKKQKASHPIWCFTVS